jgi:hypothetical protein
MRPMRREKATHRFFLFSISDNQRCARYQSLFLFPPLINLGTTHFFYKIWGEFGKKLGEKNINKNRLKIFEEK